MAKNTQLSDLAINAQGDVLARLLDNGWVDIYSGPQAADGNTPVAAQTLLASLRFSAISAGATQHGVIQFGSLATVMAVGSGTAAWYRCTKADHTTAVMDGSVGTSNANMNLNSVGIVAGANVTIAAFSHTVAGATSGL